MTCYTKEAESGCGSSNLAMGRGTSATDVDMYMEDSSVKTVGHRNWVLNPVVAEFGFGSVGRWAAMKVIGTAHRRDEGLDFYAYPPPGPCPFLVSYRWTISILNKEIADFERIEVYENSTKIGVEVDPYAASSQYTWESPRYTIAFRPKFASGKPQWSTVYSVRYFAGGDEYRYTTVLTNCLEAMSEADYAALLSAHKAPWEPKTPTPNTPTPQTPTPKTPTPKTLTPQTPTPETPISPTEPTKPTEDEGNALAGVAAAVNKLLSPGGLAVIFSIIAVLMALVILAFVLAARENRRAGLEDPSSDSSSGNGELKLSFLNGLQ